MFNKKTSSGALSCGKIAGTSVSDRLVTISKVINAVWPVNKILRTLEKFS